jgi:hypothetical protein
MLWLTWRQFRAQTWVALAALALIAIILGATAPHLFNLYNASGIATCGAHGDCGPLAGTFLGRTVPGIYLTLYNSFVPILYVIPGLIGVFWGAPLITRELETGTFRLAWNQSVTSSRWLVVKLSLIGLASMAVAGLISLMLTWWASPLNQAATLEAGPFNSVRLSPRILPPFFSASGVAPIGYAAFAFVLGVTAGVFIRRTIPAMAVTLGVFAAVQIAMPQWIRPNLIPPVHANVPLTAAVWKSAAFTSTLENGPLTVSQTIPGAWTLSQPGEAINSAGQVATIRLKSCIEVVRNPSNACFARLNLRIPITYQPASRYWPLQWYEAGIFLALALVLAGICFLRVRRRVT